MRHGAGALILAAALATSTGCGSRGPQAPSSEEAMRLLQQEADTLKRNGENLDPVLRVKATWEIAGIDLTKRPDDPDQPFAGTIRFKIKSEMRDEQGIKMDQFDRRFDYLYNAVLKRWIFQLSPSPAP